MTAGEDSTTTVGMVTVGRGDTWPVEVVPVGSPDSWSESAAVALLPIPTKLEGRGPKDVTDATLARDACAVLPVISPELEGSTAGRWGWHCS